MMQTLYSATAAVVIKFAFLLINHAVALVLDSRSIIVFGLL